MKYEYKCEKCGVVEVHQTIKDDALEECPKCGQCGRGKNKKFFQRIISGGGFLLDDSGWYGSGYSKTKD
tara:strand:- start:990 stop:1196 length:207 start_codon:yes stop_codon:yes gene_type:complete